MQDAHASFLRNRVIPTGRTGKQIAQDTGLSFSYVSKLLNGHKKITQRLFTKFLLSYGFSYESSLLYYSRLTLRNIQQMADTALPEKKSFKRKIQESFWRLFKRFFRR